MQLRETETIRGLDNHQAGIGDINANFDDRCRHKQPCLARNEALHYRVFFCAPHTSVHQRNLRSKA
jgi:hypothetical protein